MVVKQRLEPLLEPYFYPDSYGYRSEKSAIEAVAQARKRCRRYDWVLDLDIKSFFDTIDHELLLRAVRKHTDCKWLLLYVERWLKAPVQLKDGTLVGRDKGSPQGSVVPCWRISFCTMLLISGWKGSFPESRLRGTPMM
jgi:retron-type reverse transcriptase